MNPVRSASDGGHAITNGSRLASNRVRAAGVALHVVSPSTGVIHHCNAGNGGSPHAGSRHGVGVPHDASVHGDTISTHSPDFVFDEPICAHSSFPIPAGHSTGCGGGGLHIAPFGHPDTPRLSVHAVPSRWSRAKLDPSCPPPEQAMATSGAANVRRGTERIAPSYVPR
jgi:hypothetical protein